MLARDHVELVSAKVTELANASKKEEEELKKCTRYFKDEADFLDFEPYSREYFADIEEGFDQEVPPVIECEHKNTKIVPMIFSSIKICQDCNEDLGKINYNEEELYE